MSEKIIDPNLSHYFYCRDQQEQLHLLDLQTSAAVFHEVSGEGETVLSLKKGAFLSGLLLTMSHAMEKGGQPTGVAESFFDASVIQTAAPEFERFNEELVAAQPLTDNAKSHAAHNTAQNICLLMKIAHYALAHGCFSQQQKLKEGFRQALVDNRWPSDFADNMDSIFDMDLTKMPNSDIDSMLSNALNALENQKSLVQSGLEPEEYSLRA